MSVKWTSSLTREEAVQLCDLQAKLLDPPVVTDWEFGELLDRLDEEVCKREGRPCFTNYVVH